MPETYLIAFDVKLKRPGCAIVQAQMGGTVPDFGARFPERTWLLAPTPDMAIYRASEVELEALAFIACLAVDGPKEAPKSP